MTALNTISTIFAHIFWDPDVCQASVTPLSQIISFETYNPMRTGYQCLLCGKLDQLFRNLQPRAGLVCVKVAQSCLTLCNCMDYTVHGILQARILKWVAIPFSRGFSQPRDWTHVSALQADSLPVELLGKPRVGLAPGSMTPGNHD